MREVRKTLGNGGKDADLLFGSAFVFSTSGGMCTMSRCLARESFCAGRDKHVPRCLYRVYHGMSLIGLSEGENGKQKNECSIIGHTRSCRTARVDEVGVAFEEKPPRGYLLLCHAHNMVTVALLMHVLPRRLIRPHYLGPYSSLLLSLYYNQVTKIL